ncbi:MAG TPA: beta-propeller fold lactonase family protein [Chitinophagaceae bacterium]|nr:beta-propeller fold lactonase family protein [Chitinophagaceae bacterium]
MKKFPVLFSLFAISSLAFYSCKKNGVNEELASASKSISTKASSSDENTSGAVYLLNNSASGNKVLVYNRSSNGILSEAGSFATGGNGTGAGLGSQGAVILQERNGYDFLFAVNAGSNEVTAFRADASKLTWIDKISSHGTSPISVTAHGDLLYVLNAGGTGNISGFRISSDGHLTYLENSTKSLSSDNAGPAQINFNNAGSQLVVTEKNTNRISTYTVYDNGLTSNVSFHPSVGITPFGFGFDNHDQLFVTDAFGGAAGQSAVTAYSLNDNGDLSFIDGPEATHQTSACWLAITNNGKYCYASNTGSGTISGYSIQKGDLTLLNANGVTAVAGTSPGDISLNNNSKFLYNVNSTSHSITSFGVNEDGSLNAIGVVNNLPAGTAGLAAK